jgi:hypothetical protein
VRRQNGALFLERDVDHEDVDRGPNVVFAPSAWKECLFDNDMGDRRYA